VNTTIKVELTEKLIHETIARMTKAAQEGHKLDGIVATGRATVDTALTADYVKQRATLLDELAPSLKGMAEQILAQEQAKKTPAKK
jgi:hypothetical protein